MLRRNTETAPGKVTQVEHSLPGHDEPASRPGAGGPPANGFPGTLARGSAPALRVQVSSKQHVHNATDGVRHVASEVSQELAHTRHKAAEHVVHTRKHALAKGTQAPALIAQSKAHAAAHQHEAAALAKTAPTTPHAAPATVHMHVPASGPTGGDAGGIHLKPIASWDKFLPKRLPADGKQRQELVSRVQADVTQKRQESAGLLDSLRVQQATAAMSLRAQLPAVQTRITAGKSAAVARVDAAEQNKVSALWAQISGLQSQVRTSAAASKTRVDGAHTAALATFATAKQTAVQKLVAAQTQALAGIDQAEADQLTAVASQFAATHDAVTAVANDKAGAAAAKGDSHAFAYEGDQLNAARDAAHQVAKAWADGIPAQGAKSWEQIAGEQANCENGVRKMASDQRAQINAAFDQCRQTLDAALAQATQSATQVRTQTASQLDTSTTTTVAQLSAHGTAQSGAIRQAAASARSDLDTAASQALTSASSLVAKSAAGIESGSAALARSARTLEAPDPHVTGAQVSEAIGKLKQSSQGVNAALDRAASDSTTAMNGQADHASTSIDQVGESATQSASSMAAGAQQALTQTEGGALTGLSQLTTNLASNADGIATQGGQAMAGLVTSLREAFAKSTASLHDSLGGCVNNIAASFDDAINNAEDKQIQEEGDKAAANVKPWWQQALAMVVSIVVSIAVVIVITALIATTGPIGLLLVGAAAGALGSVLGQMASNLVLGNDIMANVTIQTAITGAIGGAIGAGLGGIISAGINKFGSAGLQAIMKGGGGLTGLGVRTTIGAVNNEITDAATQLITTGTYQFDMTSLIASIATSAATSTSLFSEGTAGIAGDIRAHTGYIELGSAGHPFSLRPTYHPATPPATAPVHAPVTKPAADEALAPATSDGQPAARQPGEPVKNPQKFDAFPQPEMTPEQLAASPTSSGPAPTTMGPDGQPAARQPGEPVKNPQKFDAFPQPEMTPEQLAASPTSSGPAPTTMGPDGQPAARQPGQPVANPQKFDAFPQPEMTPEQLAASPTSSRPGPTTMAADGQPAARVPGAPTAKPAAWEPPPAAPVDQGWQPPARGPQAVPAQAPAALAPAPTTELAARAPAPASSPQTSTVPKAEPVTMDLVVEKSGVPKEILAGMEGNPTLAKFKDALTRLSESRARSAALADTPSWSKVSQDASAERLAAARDVKFQAEMLQSEAKHVAAKLDWQARMVGGGVDFDTVANTGADSIKSMYGKATAEMDAAARSVIDYRTGRVTPVHGDSAFPLANNEFIYDMQRMSSGDPVSRAARSVGLVADAEDGGHIGTARYNHLLELQQRGIKVVIDDPDFSSQWTSRSPQAAGAAERFAYYVQEGNLHIRNVQLDQTANTTPIPRGATIVTESIPMSTAEGVRAYANLVRSLIGATTAR